MNAQTGQPTSLPLLARCQRAVIANGMRLVLSSLEKTDVSEQPDTTGRQPENQAVTLVRDVLAVLPREVTMEIALPFTPKLMRFCIAIGPTLPAPLSTSPENLATRVANSSPPLASRKWFGRKENGHHD